MIPQMKLIIIIIMERITKFKIKQMGIMEQVDMMKKTTKQTI